MIIIIAGIVFVGTVWWLMRRTVRPPEITPETELEKEELTPRQIRAELRAQRAELRAHSNTNAHALRTANQISRLARSLARTFK
jgi:hypothetical protein